MCDGHSGCLKDGNELLDYLRYRMALRRLSKRKRNIRAAFKKQLTSARAAGKSTDDLRALESDAWFEEGMVDEEIAWLITDFLLSKADKHFIATPSRNEEGMWEQCSKISERFVLTKAGISAIRSGIRAERKERSYFVFPIIAAVTGLIGAIIGLITVLKK